jgi:hypothetical protein
MSDVPLIDAGARLGHHVASRSPLALRHRLVGHPLLDIDPIADLAERLGPDSISAERAEKDLVAAEGVSDRLTVRAISEQIRELAANDSWFTLLNIERVPAYGDLVDEIVDEVARQAGVDGATLRRRMGFVFASSPRSVTSAHFDIEQSFCLQLQGHRRLGFGRFADDAQREREIRRYWGGTSFGKLETMPEQIDEVALGPGEGAYIPPYTPHWLSNGATPSLSLTVTFFNRDNEDESLVQAFNEKVRRAGLHPHPYGATPVRDRAKAGAMRGYAALRRRLRPETSASH